ncbi:Tripeptidyl-peptidase sed3 [Aspergillus wentii]
MVSITYVLGTLSLFLSGLQLAQAFTPGHQIIERLGNAPKGWERGGAPPPSTLMRFRLALYQERAAEFEQKVMDLATPDHHSYGKHMNRDEIREYLRPSDQALEAIISWMESEHVSANSVEIHGNWITFTVPVFKAEQLLKTQFVHFYNDVTKTTVIRTLEYSVPREVHSYVQLIQPTTRFGHSGPQAGQPSLKPAVVGFDELTGNCSINMTPDCLRQLYGIFDTYARPDPCNRLGISGYLDQYARYDDFHAFMQTFAPNRTDANFTVVSINGGLNEQNSAKGSTEASLDMQYSAALAYDTLTTFYTTAGRAPRNPGVDSNPTVSSNEPYLEQLHYLLGLTDEELPAVLSTSYGEYEQNVPESYLEATCNLFAQLGARGVSVIFSSGDSGAGGSCLTNDGTSRTRFQPFFPATCPFVTSVGGTYDMKPEKAAKFSGGGFSERFRRPVYQEQSVNAYLKLLGNKWDGLYNAQGRGVPDVAAQASDFVIVDHGSLLRIGGTSAAAPVFAAIISRLNAARLAQNQPRMGFLNPWLYSINQTGFADIVDGGSTGCTGKSESGGRASFVPYASWNATTGWDPATGLGTPFFNTLVKVATAP